MAFVNKQSISKASTVLLAVSAAFLMTACGGGSSGESESNEKAESSETATPAPTPTPTPATSATPTPTPTPAPAATPTPAPASSAGSLGKTAWSNNCVACHGSNTSKGTNAGKTMNAIATNIGGMGILNGNVSANDANNIAVYAVNPAAY